MVPATAAGIRRGWLGLHASKSDASTERALATACHFIRGIQRLHRLGLEKSGTAGRSAEVYAVYVEDRLRL